MHVRVFQPYTFEQLHNMATLRDHCAHMLAFYTETFRHTTTGPLYDAAWNGCEEYYHRGVDPRDWQSA